MAPYEQKNVLDGMSNDDSMLTDNIANLKLEGTPLDQNELSDMRATQLIGFKKNTMKLE